MRIRSVVVAALALVSSAGSAAASDNICTSIPFSGPPAAPATLVGSDDLQNNNANTELAFVQSLPGLANAVEVPCTFTPPNTGTNGTWQSQSQVTHIMVKAGTLNQVFSVSPGTSGTWTTQCIVNNLVSKRPQDLSHGRCYSNGGTNPQLGKVIIEKTAVDGDGTTEFDFTGDLAFTLLPPANGTVSQTFNNIASGSVFAVTETPVPGWTTTVTCSDPSADSTPNGGPVPGSAVTIKVTAPETVKCTFVNTKIPTPKKGSITIKKKTVGGFDTFQFSTVGQGLSNFSLTTAPASNPDERTFSNLDLNEQYSVTETLTAGWKFDGANCSTGGNPSGSTATITLTDANKDVTCTFTNSKKSDDPMEEETERFIHRRVDNLLTYGPDRARMLRRLQEAPQQPQSLKDEPLKLGAVSSSMSSLGGASAGAESFGAMGAMSVLPSNNSRAPAFGSSLGNNPFAMAKLPGDESDEGEAGAYGQPTAPSVFSKVAGQFTPLANGQGAYNFSMSLSELRAAAVAADEQSARRKLDDAGLSLASQPYTNPYLTSRQGLDVWVEGHVAKYDDDLGGINREGDFRLLYIGADYLLRPGFLVGALVQIDDTNEDIDDPIRSGRIDGTGWMAGPYVGIKVLENLYFDARAAWGRSDNDIELTDAAGSRSGKFDTDRWLATASLTGNERFGAWRFSPQIAIAYGSESSDAYTNSLGQAVGSTDAKIGRLTGTAEVGYRFLRPNGTIIEPHIALTGIWNFDSDDLTINGELVDSEESRVKVEGGILVTMPNGVGVRGAASYDGIGADDYRAVSGSLWLNVPLN